VITWAHKRDRGKVRSYGFDETSSLLFVVDIEAQGQDIGSVGTPHFCSHRDELHQVANLLSAMLSMDLFAVTIITTTQSHDYHDLELSIYTASQCLGGEQD
jgi:hypothetical protein